MKKRNEPDSINALFKQYSLKVYNLRYFYIGCIILLVAVSFLVNRSTQKVYQINATIGPVQENSASVLASGNMFSGLGAYNSGKNIEDAINTLNSFSLILSTVSALNLEVGYFREEKSILKHTSEIYLNSPFQINIDKSHIQAINTKFYITLLNDSTFKLTASYKKAPLYNYIDGKIVSKKTVMEIDTICRFNKTITSKNFKLSVTFKKELLTPEEKAKKDKFFFALFNNEELAKYYLKNLKIEPVSVLASIINLQFTGENLDKSIGFLNSYVNSFLDGNLEKKNKTAKKSIKFIDDQISNVSDSLGKSESKLTNYRSANQVTDLSFQGQRNYDQMAAIETDRTNLELQARYYNYVLNLFRTSQDISGVSPPNSANITDPLMNKLISDLADLNTERSGIIIKNNNEKNIFLIQVDNKIKTLKQQIIENITNNLNTINLTLSELSYKSEKLAKEAANLPKTEMNMVNIQRKFNLNTANYTFLLQKRTEAAIALASNNPDYELLEPAREITSEIIKPKTVINYLLALFLGFLIPTIILVVKDLLNDKISSVYDIEHILDRSVFGIIYKNHKNYESVVVDSPKSAISESFRNLRSSIFLKLKAEKIKVILVTSSQPGDGKSFISFNLAASIASVGYKTVIVDCDLRRPVLHKKFNDNNSIGVSNVMDRDEKKRADYNSIIKNTSIDDLFFIPAGPFVANPSELIDLGVLDNLILFLKTKYDYIIIDTSPVAIVSDSIQLMKYASQILIVSRLNTTQKDIFSNAIASLESNQINNFEVVLNDMDIEKSPYSGYKSYYLKE
jgi:tyrosine-protein kinase Etk/Wzc